MKIVWGLLPVLTLVACSRPSNAHRNGPTASPTDSLGLVEAASRAYEAELAAMSAYARAECHECPSEAPHFLAGSRHAFTLATRVYPKDPRGFLGLANVLFSSGFVGDGDPVDSTLQLAQTAAERAVALSTTDSMRAVAESLVVRIKHAR